MSHTRHAHPVFAAVIVGAVVIGLLLVSRISAARAVGTPDDVATCQNTVAAAASFAFSDVSVYRAEAATVELVAQWQELRDLQYGITYVSRLRERPATQGVTVCLYSGEFMINRAKVPPDLLRLLVFDNGETEVDSTGYKGRMSPETPKDWLTNFPVTSGIPSASFSMASQE
jgi:hypothetical protein